VVNDPLTKFGDAGRSGFGPRLVEATSTILSFGTNKLVRRGSAWLKRNGLARYVVPALLLNEAFGAYRIYLAADTTGWW
jgi:hypothetical protein